MGVSLELARSLRIRQQFATRYDGRSIEMGLLKIGIYHRRRRRHGQQFCPTCFAVDSAPYLRRRWRSAWQFGCQAHACLLRDACPYCDTPLVIHKSHGSMHRCPQCDGSLVQATRALSDSETNAQRLLTDSALFPTTQLHAEWLAGVRFAYTVLGRLGSGAAPASVVEQTRTAPRACRLDALVARLPELCSASFSRLVSESCVSMAVWYDAASSMAPDWALQGLLDWRPPRVRLAQWMRRRAPRSVRESAQSLRAQVDLGQHMRRMCAIASRAGTA